MAIGDDAMEAGLPLVPDSGEEGRVRWGGREINRTRDFIGQVKKLIPLGKAKYRENSGISYGSTVPANAVGDEGDIFFKVL